MKTGYDDFFRKARKNAAGGTSAADKISVKSGARRSSSSQSVFSQPAAGAERKSQAAGIDASQIRELRERLKKSKRPKKKSFPKSVVVATVLGFILTGVGFLNHEEIDQWLSGIEISATTRAVAAEDRKPAAVDAKAVESEKAPVTSAADLKPEEINHLKKLVERKDELDAREEELRRLEAELQAQKGDLEKKMKQLEEARTGISGVLSEKSSQDQAKVESLVQMYSSMKPAQAAKVLENMDEDLAVEIIGRMKKKNAAEVMNLMKAEKAQAFSEKFAGYRKR